MATLDIPVTPPIKKKGGQFLQLSLSRVDAIAKADLGPDALSAYIVLAGGVDSRAKSARASTHSVKSVSARTMLSRRAATAALEQLEKHGFIQRCLSSGLQSTISGKFEPQWQIEGESERDLFLDHGFLAPRNSDLPLDSQAKKGTLAYLCHSVTVADSIPQQNALLDALLVFLHLQLHQDFGDFAGVDPCHVGTRFTGIEIGEDGMSCDVPQANVPDWALVIEKEPSCANKLSKMFLNLALGQVPTWDGAPSLEQRGEHALQQLRASDLIYHAHVVWSANPMTKATAVHPLPLFTLYVRGSWVDKSTEDFLQVDVNQALQDTGTYEGSSIWGDSRGTQSIFAYSGMYRYLVPRQHRKAVLIRQIRVRWWAYTQETHAALEKDQSRVSDWRGMLRKLRNEPRLES